MMDQKATQIQSWLRCKCVSALFKLIIVEYRRFWVDCGDYKIAEAYNRNTNLKKLHSSLIRLVGYAILKHVIQEFDTECVLVQKRVNLIEEAKTKLNATTVEQILSLKDVTLTAIDLELSNHPIIEEAKKKVKRYGKGVEFTAIILSPDQISSLSFNDINEGIETLKEFNVIIPGAEDTIVRALEHKRIVEYELFHILKPMQDLLAECFVIFDKKTGNLVTKTPQSYNVFDRVAQLRDLLVAHAGMKFNCIDLGLLFTDCTSYVRFMTHFVSNLHAVGAQDFIDGLKPTSDIFKLQIEEFRKWVDLHMSSFYLQQQLQVGCIPRSDTGNEEVVQIEAVEKLLRPIEILEVPPPHFMSVIKAAQAILEVGHQFPLVIIDSTFLSSFNSCVNALQVRIGSNWSHWFNELNAAI